MESFAKQVLSVQSGLFPRKCVQLGNLCDFHVEGIITKDQSLCAEMAESIVHHEEREDQVHSLCWHNKQNTPAQILTALDGCPQQENENAWWHCVAPYFTAEKKKTIGSEKQF